jgi:hypothetical protein
MRIEKYGKTRFWAVYDTNNELICICVYFKGAREVLRRLQGQKTSHVREDRSSKVVSERC